MITERDWDVIKAIDNTGAMTTGQIAQVFFLKGNNIVSAKTKARQRLNILKNKKYIVDGGKIMREKVWKSNEAKTGNRLISHSVLVGEFYIFLAQRYRDWKNFRVYTEKDIRERAMVLFGSSDSIQIADLYVSYKYLNMIVEAETGKTNWRDIRNKIKAYSNLFQDKAKRDVYGKKPRIFWIVITQKREDEIRFLLREHGLEDISRILVFKNRRDV